MFQIFVILSLYILLSFFKPYIIVANRWVSNSVQHIQTKQLQTIPEQKKVDARIWEEDPFQIKFNLQKNNSQDKLNQQVKTNQGVKKLKKRTWQDDPFQLNAKLIKQSDQTQLYLQGIWSYNSSKKAIISGKSLEIGDQIEGWTLQGINHSSVNLYQNQTGQNLVLEYLNKDDSQPNLKTAKAPK